MRNASTKDNNDYVTVDIPPPTLHRLPRQVREGKDQIYDPVLVSLGPYHHGQPRLKEVEDLKLEILRLLIPDGREEQLLLKEIQSRSREIRSFYGLSPLEDAFDDEALAQMMLRDACFLIFCLKKMAAHDDDCIILDRIGMWRLAFVVRDLFMLENQLPFFLLKMLIPFTCNGVDDKSVDAFLYMLVSSMINRGDSCSERLPQIFQGRQIIHLLEACRIALVEKKKSAEGVIETVQEKAAVAVNSQFRSVTDLKAKWIYFRPTKSKSYCLKDIRFRSHWIYGILRLPIVLVDNKTNVIFSNMIAMEMSPGRGNDFAVTSYVKFMKSLIMKAEDVKELREQGILVSCLANDEEVVAMFRELNMEGSYRKDIFRGVRERINEHCRSKTKTFKAKLIALFAAILLLSLRQLSQISPSLIITN